MVHAFTDHCVKRYGIAKVSDWKFEVWNEPNIAFWAGTQAEYFELYRQSVEAIKEVHPRLKVGGPSTAELDGIPDLIQYCVQKGLPLDFVSSHVYPNDPQRHMFGRDNMYSFEQVIPRGVAQVEASRIFGYASPTGLDNRMELPESGLNRGYDQELYWPGGGHVLSTVTDVFEEGGVPSGIFNSTFGLTDQWGIARPSLHAFAFLHKLGETRLQCSDGPVLATRRADGSVAILLWNLIPSKDAGSVANGNPAAASGGALKSTGQEKTFQLRLNGLDGRTK